MKVAVTGRPGIGKTTLCLKVYDALKDKLSVAGFVTREVREGGRRIGFKLVNLSSGDETWLAKVGEGKFKVGKYVVFVENLDRFLDSVNIESDFIIIDEVGPMELKSKRFVEFMDRVLERDNVLVTIHYKSKHRLVEKIRGAFKVYTIDETNRNAVAEEIVKLYDR